MIKKTLISNCDILSDWTVTSGTVTIDYATKDVESGIGSIKCVTNATAYQTAGVEISGSWNLWEENPVFNVLFDVANPPDRFFIEVYSGNSKYARRWFSRDVMCPGIYWDISFNKADAKFFNGFTDSDYNNITKIRAYFTTTTAASKTGYINKLEMIDIIFDPFFMIRHDDGYLTDYTISKPILEERGVRANHFISTHGTDYNPNSMTSEQILELEDLKHDNGCHSHLHIHLANQMDDCITGQFGISQNFMKNLGVKAWNLFVAPYFNIDSRVYNYAKDYYLNCGCGAGWCGDNTGGVTGGYQSFTNPMPNFRQIPDATGLAAINDINVWNTAFDKILHYGESIVLGWHQITNATLYEQIIDSLLERGFVDKTFTELYSENYKEPVKININQLLR